QDGIHANAAASPLRAQLACHLRHGAHGHAVGDMAAAQRGNAGERTNVYNAAPSRFEHAAPRFLTAAEAAVDEVAPSTLDVVQGDLLGLTQNAFTGDIAQEIDPAELAVKLGKHRANLLRIGDVAGDRARAAAHAGDQLRGVIRAGRVNV